MSSISDMLLIDIETVPGNRSFADLDDRLKELWKIKHTQLKLGEEISPDESYEDRAGIYAEFGKIICISMGVLIDENDTICVRIQSFYGHDESKLLSEFCQFMMDKYKDSRNKSICGHNIREFDVPYLCRRILINGLRLPSILDIGGKKPWEVNHIDTMQLWKFGDYKSYTSLKLLTAVFDIPTPKDDIDGSDVANVYWKDNDLEKIVSYCQKDVLAVGRLWTKMNGLGTIEDRNITLKEKANAEL